MKRSTKKSLYKIFVSLFVVFYTFLPQSIVIGQVIDEVSQENAAPIEVVQDVTPQENAAPTEEVVPENNITEVKEEIPQEKPLWLVDGNTAVTSNPVELDKEYTAPQNDKVKIIFTKLPDNPSSVKIKEITLTEEEIKVSGAVSDKAYDITADMVDGTFEYDLVLPSVKDGIKVVYAEDRDSILTDLKEIDNEIVNENNSIEIKDLDHFTLFIVTNPGPKLSTVMVNGMPYVSVPPSTNITVKLQVTTSGSGGDNNWRATGYKIDSGSWICINTSDHYSSGTYTEEFGIIAPSTVGSYNLSLLAYSENGCTGLVSNEVTLTDAIKVVTSSPSLTPPTLTENPSDPISLTSVSGVWTSISGGSGYQGIGTNEIRWGTPAGTQKSGLKFTNSGNQSFKTGDTFYLGMLTHMNWPTSHGTAATGAKLQITLDFNRPDIDNAVLSYDFSIEETSNSQGNCPIYQRTLTACDDKVTFPNSYGTTVFTIGDIIYTLVIDGFVDAYPTGTAVDAFITEEEKDNSAFLVGHLSSVLVEKPQITLTKKVNDKDVSAAPGPNLYIGDSVTWQYIVQNTGNVDLTNVTVVDNPSANIDCDPLTEGNQNSGLTLASGASMTCEATGTVVQGQFSNTATVTGTPPNGVNVTDSDSSWYYGIWKPGHIIVQKTTIPAADPTSFTIEATGSGTITGGGIGTVTDSTDKDYEVTPGTYSVTETVPTGWSLTSNDCTNINVAAGETKYCTITNAKNGSITIIKDAKPDSTQSFSFTASQEMGSSSFTLYGVTNDATHPNTRTFSNLPAGAYTVKELPDEDNVGGDWVLTSLTCVDPTGNSSADTTNPYQANINLAAGEAVTCTFTNMMLPKLTITKTVINHGLSYGTDHFSPYKVGTTVVTLNQATSFNPGTYTVSETEDSNYTVTFGGDCDSHGSVTLVAGDNKTCTITNEEKLTYLTLVKTVTNDNGGKALATEWTLTATGPTNISGKTGDASITNVAVNSGVYTLSESGGPSGYTMGNWSCTGGSLSGNQITLSSGQSATCTLTNNDQAGTLIVKKVVVNDDGGKLGAEDFTFKIGDGSPVAFEADGQNDIIINAGTYTITEPAVSGYTTTYDNCSGVVVVNGGTQTCTITNNDQAGTLIVKKVVVNDDGGTLGAKDFTFKIDDGSPVAFEADGQNDVVINAGTYTITEPAVSGYTTTYDNCSGVVVVNGGTQTCTITNDDIAPGLTVIKKVVNDNGGNAVVGDFDIKLDGTELSFRAGVVDGTTTTYTSNPTVVSNHEYTLSEIDFGGYTEGTWNCGTVDGLTTKFTLNEGQNITCTITNDDIAPGLTVIKKVVNDNGGNAVVGDFDIKLDGTELSFRAGVVDGTTTTYTSNPTVVSNHEYTLSEIDFGGYTEGTWNCGTVDGLTTKFTLNEGQNITCTITNDDQSGSITIKKDVANYLGVYEDIYSSSIFSVYLNEDPLTAKDISDEVVNPSIATYIDMDAGDYSLNEVVTDGYSLEGCYIISDETAELIEDNQFRLNNGQDLEIVCKNMEIEPQLKITKDNNSPIDGLLSGSTVLYTIIVTAPSNEEEETYLINNVKVTDILPKGFEYMSGTWTANSSVRGNIKGSITQEPEYNGVPAIWNLGDMKEGEIVTLTYTAKINLLNEPGLYKDIAFVQGDSLLAEKDSGDVLGISYDPSEYLHTDTLGDNFVGTKVLVIEPMEEGGEVLGASTTLTLPKTGAETYITLGAIISMILGILLFVFGKKRKLNTILLSTVLLLGILTLVKPIQIYAQVPNAKVSVRLEQPKTGITDREFNITYVALSIPVKPITVQCQYSLDGVNFSNFDISKTTNSGDCKVDQSIVTGSGTYYFRAIASTTDGGAESEVITVKVADKPSPVTEYSKAKAVCTYTLKFKSSTSKVQIFRSDNQKSFYADDTTLITKPYLTVTPNALSTYTDTPADCSKEYYYAVRAVDEYSNVSALVTDNVVTVVEQTQTSTSQESEEVAGEETTTQQEQETTSTGEVAGEETTAQQEEKAETDTKDETKIEEKETEESIWDKYKYLIISVIVVVLGSGIYNYIRRKK